MRLEDWAKRLSTWPKTDLHCHLDGSLRPSTLSDLALEQGGALGGATDDQVREAVRAGRKCRSLRDYLNAFRITLSVLQREEALARVAREVVEDAAAEGVRLLELRFCPFLHGQEGLGPEAAIDAVGHGLSEAATADPRIHVGLILCAMRDRDRAESQALVDMALRRSDRGVVGIDLAGPEAGHPAQVHGYAFEAAREAGLGVTVHAGEADGPSSVWSAIRDCRAQRIGHGCRAVDDPQLLAAMVEAGVTVEACPRSNLQTGAISSLDNHPLRTLTGSGIPVTVATDNRLITDTTVSLELARLAVTFGLRESELADLVLAGFAAAFAAPALRATLALEARRTIEAQGPGLE